MKVAIVTSFPRDLSKPQGGVEAVSVNLAKALAGFDDLDIHVVTFDPRVSATEIDSLEKITVHRLPAPKGSVLVTALTTGRHVACDYLRRIKPEVVHSHDTYGLMVKGLDLPRVFTIHGFIHADTLVSGVNLPKLRSKIWKWVETSGWADQPHIISISPYVRERISGVVQRTIHDIENPISETFFHSIRNERPGTIFSSAVICPRKNTLALIEAVKILVNEGIEMQLRLAGRIVDVEYGDAVKMKIVSENLDGKVVLLGQISSLQVAVELSQASVYALVSIEENAPLGIEEAMAVGVPVVASNICGMPYMVRHGETGFLINPNSPMDISRRLRRLLGNRALRNTMAKYAKAIAREHYHPQKVAMRTREVYYDAVNTIDV